MKPDLISREALLKEIAEWRMPSHSNTLDRHLDEFEEAINAMRGVLPGMPVLSAIVAWLERNQQDVFSRGLWDVIVNASKESSDEGESTEFNLLMLARRLERDRARLKEALRSTGIGMMAETTNMIDGHSWVAKVDGSSAWCQWCGVHQLEIPDWMDNPQCHAFANVRTALASLEEK